MKIVLMKYMETSKRNISFGRSIYINLGEQVVTQVLEEMKAARQTVAFTSFQLPEHPLEIADMTRLVELARSYEVDLIPDIAHKDLTKENIAVLKNAGLSYLRLDEFGDEAFIERCGKAFTLVVNASTFTNREYQLLERLGFAKQIIACHNYYPKVYSGISLEKFTAINQKLQALGVKVLAFIPGDEPLRGPLHEGLPTVETHRTLDTRLAICELIRAHTDMILVGDTFIHESTQKVMKEFQEGFVSLKAQVPVELTGKVLRDRIDASDFVYRILGTRGWAMLDGEVSTTIRTVGEINQANAGYGRYQGEIEITKESLPSDARQNVIGHLLPSEIAVFKALPEGISIRFEVE
nr:MupG family TIM beta-alpha barrel fold protein [uncultured Granulicatella sp.]